MWLNLNSPRSMILASLWGGPNLKLLNGSQMRSPRAARGLECWRHWKSKNVLELKFIYPIFEWIDLAVHRDPEPSPPLLLWLLEGGLPCLEVQLLDRSEWMDGISRSGAGRNCQGWTHGMIWDLRARWPNDEGSLTAAKKARFLCDNCTTHRKAGKGRSEVIA